MTAVLMTPPYLQFFDSFGAPLAGGKLYTFTATGTFTVPKATYTTAAGTIAQENPIILDSAGRCTPWLSGTYDFLVEDSLGNVLETTLGVTAFTTLPASANSYFQSFSGDGVQTAFTASADLGTDEKSIFVWINNGLPPCVANGTFASDTIWTKGAGWTIAGGVAVATGAISTAISQAAIQTLVQGQAYNVTYTITRSAGGLIPSIGGTNGTERTASGTYNETIIAGSSQTIAFTGDVFTGTLDNVVINVASTAGYDIQNPSAYTINGTALTFSVAPPAGVGNIYVSAPSLLVGAASSAAADAAASAAAAANSSTAAANSATAAAASAAQLSGTSTTSLAIAVASQTFTTQSGKFFNTGNFLLITSNADVTNYMYGQVTAYSGTTLTVNVTNIGGSGTHSDWTIYLSGTRGQKGDTGTIGDLSGVPAATITSSDKIIFQDVSDSNLTKSTALSGVLSLTLQPTNNLSDVSSATTCRTNLSLGTAALLNTGTATNNVVQYASSNKLPATDGSALTGITSSQISGLVLTKTYNSGAQTIVDGGTITLTHGLGKAPTDITVFLTCLTNSGGYTAGQTFFINPAGDVTSASSGNSIIFNSTTTIVRFGSSDQQLTNANTGSGTTGAAANFSMTFILSA